MKHWPTDANILDPDIFPTEKGPPHGLLEAWRDVDPVHWNPATPNYVPTIPASSMTKGFWVLKHLSFGTGPHVCIGARLARMELHALLKQILTRIPDFQVSGEPEWLRSIWFNAITQLPIAFTPENRAAP